MLTRFCIIHNMSTMSLTLPILLFVTCILFLWHTIFGNFASLNFCNFWVYLGLIAKFLPHKILKVFPCHTFFWIICKIIFTKSLKFLLLRKCKIFAVYGPLSARENNSIHWGLGSLCLYTLPPPSEKGTTHHAGTYSYKIHYYLHVLCVYTIN